MKYCLKQTKGHHYIRTESRVIFSAHCLIMPYICTKFHEGIISGFKVMERTLGQNLTICIKLEICQYDTEAPA